MPRSDIPNAVLCSRLYAALWRPLPYPESNRLVAIVDGFRSTGAIHVSPTVPEMLDVRSWSRNFEALSFFDTRDFQIKQALRTISPLQPVFDVRPMDEIVAQPLLRPETIARLLGMFALVALVVSTMGIYTVVVYLTSRRFKEIAVRGAMGATASDVLALLAGPTAWWTVAGLAAGMLGAFAAAGALRATVLRTASLDPFMIGILAIVYIAIVAPAICIPAARAVRLDPSAVLRAD